MPGKTWQRSTAPRPESMVVEDGARVHLPSCGHGGASPPRCPRPSNEGRCRGIGLCSDAQLATASPTPAPQIMTGRVCHGERVHGPECYLRGASGTQCAGLALAMVSLGQVQQLAQATEGYHAPSRPWHVQTSPTPHAPAPGCPRCLPDPAGRCRRGPWAYGRGSGHPGEDSIKHACRRAGAFPHGCAAHHIHSSPCVLTAAVW